MKRSVNMFLLIFLACTLTGCVWLRLLRTKNQLAEFETYFSISTPSEDNAHHSGYILTFNSPLLSGENIRYITFGPNHIYNEPKDPTRTVWAYLFEKEDDPDQAPMHTYLTFNEDGLLDAIRFSPAFSKLITPEQFATTATALGTASVLRNKRAVNARVVTSAMSPPLTKRGVLSTLGHPNEQRVEKGVPIWFYRYRLRGKLQNVWLLLSFSGNTLVTMKTHLAGGTITITFEQPSAEDERDANIESYHEQQNWKVHHNE